MIFPQTPPLSGRLLAGSQRVSRKDALRVSLLGGLCLCDEETPEMINCFVSGV